MVEGNKIIKELKNSPFQVEEIYSTNPAEIDFFGDKIIPISDSELKKISFLKTPKDSVAVCRLKSSSILDASINIVLDGIQDPGNLGTIIRLADWFGIEQVICSKDTVDVYNPKVIQATMGSFTRVNVSYTALSDFLTGTEGVNIGTDMEGTSLFEFDFPKKFNLILGNEGNGIKPETLSSLSHKITIPRFGKNQSAESLNVSMAAAIITAQIFAKH